MLFSPKSVMIAVGMSSLIFLTNCQKEDDVAPLPPPPAPEFQTVSPPEDVPDFQPMDEAANPPGSPALESVAQDDDMDLYRDVISAEGKYVIQIGVHENKYLAKKMAEKIESKGYSTYLAEVRNPGELDGSFYRVRMGYFKTVTAARLFGHNVIKPLGYAFWIDNKENDEIGSPASDDDSRYNEVDDDAGLPDPQDWSSKPAQESGWGSSETNTSTPASTYQEPAKTTTSTPVNDDMGWSNSEASSPPPAASATTQPEPVVVDQVITDTDGGAGAATPSSETQSNSEWGDPGDDW